MSRFRTFLMVSAAVVLGACSDTQPPTSSTEPEAELRREGGSQVGQTDAEVRKKGSAEQGVGLEHFTRCNSGGWECMLIYHSGNFVGRVGSTAFARGYGCSRAHFFTNGYLRAVTNRVCHGPGDRLIANWYPRARYYWGTNFCVDWRGGWASPPGYVCQRL